MVVTYEMCRLGGFYLFSVGIGGLANILAYGLMQMEGVGGLRGWRWIFIIGKSAPSLLRIWAASLRCSSYQHENPQAFSRSID
jgi:hypothetical protein